MIEQKPTPAQTLHELHEILLLAALDNPLQREIATRYTLCRELLLQSELRPALPGFLQQCLTVHRFHDFIHLYHASVEARTSFIEETLRSAMNRARAKRDPETLHGAFPGPS